MDLINILDASEKAIGTLMLEVNRLNNEIILKDKQIEALKKELALQRLSDIGQAIERQLTDFEIKSVMALDECWIGEDCSTPNMIAFARAILRKASEI